MTQKKVIKKETTNKNSDRKKSEKHYHYWYHPPASSGRTYNDYPYKKLYRSTRDKWLGGVCGGIAEHFNKDPVIIRLLWILVTIFSVGFGVIAYIIFWLVLDKNPGYYALPSEFASPNLPKDVHYHYHYHYKQPQ
jgi:phage shock protein C